MNSPAFPPASAPVGFRSPKKIAADGRLQVKTQMNEAIVTEFPDRILHERKLQAALASLQASAESIYDDLTPDGDDDPPDAWHEAGRILAVVEELEELLFNATGLRGAP